MNASFRCAGDLFTASESCVRDLTHSLESVATSLGNHRLAEGIALLKRPWDADKVICLDALLSARTDRRTLASLLARAGDKLRAEIAWADYSELELQNLVNGLKQSLLLHQDPTRQIMSDTFNVPRNLPRRGLS